VENIVRTVFGANIQTALKFNRAPTIYPYSTLNEKLNIHNAVPLLETDRHTFKYMAIGNGGHRVAVGADNIAKFETIQHSPKHAGLYNQLPFVLKRTNDDLSITDRLKYRLRRIETHSGEEYAAYYLRVLDIENTETTLELRTVIDGNITSSEFVPSIADLSPTPPNIIPGNALVTSGDYIAATSKVSFTMTNLEIQDFLDVCTIIYGDDDYAIISEMGLCAGVDKAVTGDFNGATLGYTDAIAVQITNHIGTSIIAKSANAGINILFDLGSIEPLLVLA